MDLGKNHSTMSVPTYLQPTTFTDCLSAKQEYCLFLDIDGTLAPFTPNPKDSVIPDSTLIILKNLQDLGVNIAIVTGRSLIEAKQMLSPMQLAIAATHGLEISYDGKADSIEEHQNYPNVVNAVEIDSAKVSNELADIKQYIRQFCTHYPDFIVEDKPYSVALHYRQNPTLAEVAYTIMLEALDKRENWLLKQGKYVWELVPKGADKGTAILTLLNRMQNNRRLIAIYIGDDITDEAGFIAVQNEISSELEELTIDNYKAQRKLVTGIGIKVGSEPTSAHYYVNTIDEVTTLLKSFLNFCQAQAKITPDSIDTMTSTHPNSSTYLISPVTDEMNRPLT